MTRISYYSLLVATILFISCNPTKQLTKPVEQYDQRQDEKISIVNLPIRVNMRELEKSLNNQLEGMLYEDNNLNDGDNMMVRAQKSDTISLRVDSSSVSYRVPLSLWIKYDAGITNLEAEGDIALAFHTAFSIKENWAIETETTLSGYEWLKKPKIRTLGISLPVGIIADLILKQSRETLTKTIDEMVASNFKLEDVIQETWDLMFDPILISEEYNTWLSVNPEKIAMTELESREDSIYSTIIVQSRPKVKMGEKPENSSPLPLPPFRYVERSPKENISIHLQTDIPYSEAERIAKEELKGETFEQGSRSVTIEDIELFGQGDKLVVNTKLSGSYTGNIYMVGKPEYNKKKNSIDIKNLKFTLETKSFLLKSAAWLLRSTIKKKIQENMDFLLDYNMVEIQKQMQEQLQHYEVSKDIFLNGVLEGLNIQNAYLTPESIRVDIILKGRMDLEVNGLN